MDKKTLEDVQKASVEANLVNVDPSRHFEMAAKNQDGSLIKIICTHAVAIDTELHIRNGSALILRNLRWLVTQQVVDELLLRRPLLEALAFECQIRRSCR